MGDIWQLYIYNCFLMAFLAAIAARLVFLERFIGETDDFLREAFGFGETDLFVGDLVLPLGEAFRLNETDFFIGDLERFGVADPVLLRETDLFGELFRFGETALRIADRARPEMNKC